MKTLLNKWTIIFGICFSTLILGSCSKDDMNESLSASALKANPTSQANTEEGFINRDLIVQLAIDNGSDITTNFSGYTFRFVANGSGGGIVYASNDIMAIEGRWVLNENRSITIMFPTNLIAALAFMNKQWIMDTSTSTVKLTDPQENDVVNFVNK